MAFPDFRPAPNQGNRPDLYELENRAIDPDGLVLQAMRRLTPRSQPDRGDEPMGVRVME
jgi:hypothetical protein